MDPRFHRISARFLHIIPNVENKAAARKNTFNLRLSVFRDPRERQKFALVFCLQDLIGRMNFNAATYL